MQDPRQSTHNGYRPSPQQYHPQYFQQYPHDARQIQDRVYLQDSRYDQPEMHRHDARFHGSYGHPEPPTNGYQAYTTHAPPNQIPAPGIHQLEYRPQYQQEIPLRDSPYHSQYAPTPMPGMELVTSTVETPFVGGQKPQVMEQEAPAQDFIPPPAYSRDMNEQYPIRSSHSSSPSSSLRPVIHAAPSMGQLADGYKLVAIPATSQKLGSPFLRAYPPALENYGISRGDFIQFLDQLNRAAVASPPVQVLGLAGNIVGMVPLHTAQLVGNAVNMAATVSTIAISKGRTEILLREANSGLFGAAGLKVQVAKLDVVAKLANIPILNAEGKVDKKSSVIMPLDGDQDIHSLNAQQRRVQALSTWLSPLDVEELPELDESANMMGRMHAKVSEQQRQKEEKKMMKDRQKAHKEYFKDKNKEDQEYEKKMEEYASKENKLREKRGRRRMEHDLRELEKKREKLNKEHDKEIRKIEKDRRKDDKEEESMRKILFLVIQKV